MNQVRAYEPSDYQKAIFQHYKDQAGNSAVISVAGSGKTETAIQGIGHVPSSNSVLLGAFNTSIRDEFKDRGNAKGYTNVTYVNYNGFGWGICLRNLRHKPELDRYKSQNLLRYEIMKPRDEAEEFETRLFSPMVERIISLMKSLNIHDPMEAFLQFDEIVEHHNLDIPPQSHFKQTCLDTLEKSISWDRHYDFDDQKYMPIHHGWSIPVYDTVIIDEFQDTCPVELELMYRASGSGNFSGIGDPMQAIYGFKGATPDAFENYIVNYGAKRLPLSICYRCPKAVIREAQKLVPEIEAAPWAIEGVVETIRDKEVLGLVNDMDFILCRTTDELVGACIKLIRAGRKAKVRGRDFGQSLLGIINKVGNDLPIGEFIPRLDEYLFMRIDQLTKLNRVGEILTLEDRVSTIKALCDGLERSSGIEAKADTIFTDTPHTGIDLMTIHKSKGLQARNVYVLRPDLLPHPRSMARPWMLGEEKRLKYVAITRATEGLHWVVPPPRSSS